MGLGIEFQVLLEVLHQLVVEVLEITFQTRITWVAS